jgi:hypothetical protein
MYASSTTAEFTAAPRPGADAPGHRQRRCVINRDDSRPLPPSDGFWNPPRRRCSNVPSMTARQPGVPSESSSTHACSTRAYIVACAGDHAVRRQQADVTTGPGGFPSPGSR